MNTTYHKTIPLCSHLLAFALCGMIVLISACKNDSIVGSGANASSQSIDTLVTSWIPYSIEEPSSNYWSMGDSIEIVGELTVGNVIYQGGSLNWIAPVSFDSSKYKELIISYHRYVSNVWRGYFEPIQFFLYDFINSQTIYTSEGMIVDTMDVGEKTVSFTVKDNRFFSSVMTAGFVINIADNPSAFIILSHLKILAVRR